MSIKNNVLTLMMVFFSFGCIEKVHNEDFYTVQPGDNLSSIAYEHYKNKTYWRFVAFWNDIPLNEANNIEVGRRLKLINLGLSPVLHKVVKGETLTTIAKNNSIDLKDDLKAWNDRSTNKINEGQRLIVGWSHPLIAFFLNNKWAYFTIALLLFIAGLHFCALINKWLDSKLHKTISLFVMLILTAFITNAIAKLMGLEGQFPDFASLGIAMLNYFLSI